MAKAQAVEKKPVDPMNKFYAGGAINKTPVNVDSIEAMTVETDKKVTGTFLNVEYPGQTGFVAGKFYKGMMYFSKTFLDGERATIPYSVARHINERVESTKHAHELDDSGKPMKAIKRLPRFKFMIEQFHDR